MRQYFIFGFPFFHKAAAKRCRRKKERPFFDIFGFGEENFLVGREPAEGGSGYSISVTYEKKGKPVVQVKTYGDVDVAELRRDIEQRYPGDRIEGLEKKTLIRIVDKEREKEEAKGEKEFSMGS